MKKSFVAFMLMVVGLAGCDQASQSYQQSYSQAPVAYEQPDTRVMDAAQRSRTTALASMKYTLPSRDNNRFDCDADDDVSNDNLSGDGDADCVVYRFGRQDQYECPSNRVGVCTPDKKAAKPMGYVWGYHAKQSSRSHSYAQAQPPKPAVTSSYLAKPTTQPPVGFFGKGTTQTSKPTATTATPTQPKSGFFSGGSTKSSPGKSTTSKPAASTKSGRK